MKTEKEMKNKSKEILALFDDTWTDDDFIHVLVNFINAIPLYLHARQARKIDEKFYCKYCDEEIYRGKWFTDLWHHKKTGHCECIKKNLLYFAKPKKEPHARKK